VSKYEIEVMRTLVIGMYSYGHGISSVVVIQPTLGVKEVLYISNPTLEFLTWMSIDQSFLL
jgi:hypothetical protein